jgi:signal transduction histidine kinase
MAQRIEDLVSDISLLSSAISHEMRAPLAKLQFGLDALREEDDEETRKIYQDRLDKVITDMTNLIETLLKYARLDKNIAQLPKDEVDLLELCTNLVTSVAQGGREHNSESVKQEISINASNPFYIVKGDVFYLNLLIENLISNAVKYGRGKILISVSQDENGILFAIEDNGLGIEENFKQDIFKPFIRGEKAKSEGGANPAPQKGYGLGMALVKRIVDLHSVEIEISKSEALSGARITLLFAEPNCIRLNPY